MTEEQEAYQSLIPITADEYMERFYTCRKEAFRLETLPEFCVVDEKETFSKFKNGQITPDADYNADWHTVIAAICQRDAIIHRLRVIPEPMTDYFRYQVNWGYIGNIAAGDRVVTVPNLDVKTLDLPIVKDFWLFDDTECILVEYDLRGAYLGANLVAEKYIPCYVAVKNALLKQAVDIRTTAAWTEATTNLNPAQ